MPEPTSLQRIAALQAQIDSLKKNAISELMEKRNALSHELAEIDAELAHLTGKPVQPGKRTRAAIVGRTPSLQELKDLLTAVPGKTLNLRKEGLDAKHVKALALANPQLLRMGGKGAWPEVTLVK